LTLDSEPPQQLAGEFPPLIVDPDRDSGDTATEEDGVFAPIITTGSALLVVLALFGVFVVVSRRWGPSRPIAGGVPEDVVQHLGSTPLDAKTRVTFLKIGQRLLVIGQTQSGDPQTLSEITDPDEVERLTHRLMGRPEIVGKRSPAMSGMGIRRSDIAAG
jgi:flagellar biogenesis protein FliO